MILEKLNSLVVIHLYGALILLSFILIVNPFKVNVKANRWFGLAMFSLSTFWFEEVFKYSGIGAIYESVELLVQFIQFLVSPIIYISIILFTNPNSKFKVWDIKYLIIPSILLLLIQFNREKGLLFYFTIGLILSHALFYIIASYINLRKHKKNILTFSSSTNDIDLNWLEQVIISLLAMCVITIIYNICFVGSNPDFMVNTLFLLMVFRITFSSLKQKEIYPTNSVEREDILSINEQIEPIRKKVITDEELVEKKTLLNNLMKEQEPFLNSDLTLVKLADLIGLTSHQLSYVINTGFNENFFHYVNKYRVDKAKVLLTESSHQNITILGIGFDSGFSSKTVFNTTFKKFTGVTPSEFKKRSSTL